MKKSFYLIVLAAACALSSCNTFIGMGRDIQSVGSGMQNTGHGRSWNGEAAPAQTAPVQQAADTEQAPPQ